MSETILRWFLIDFEDKNDRGWNQNWKKNEDRWKSSDRQKVRKKTNTKTRIFDVE